VGFISDDGMWGPFQTTLCRVFYYEDNFPSFWLCIVAHLIMLYQLYSHMRCEQVGDTVLSIIRHSTVLWTCWKHCWFFIALLQIDRSLCYVRYNSYWSLSNQPCFQNKLSNSKLQDLPLETSSWSISQEIPSFYVTQKFIITFIKVCHWALSWAIWIHSWLNILVL